MSIEFIEQQKAANILTYPSLIVGLSDSQIAWSNYHQKVNGFSIHQIESAHLTIEELGWHPKYVLEIAASTRPSLLEDKSNFDGWKRFCENWQLEHDSSVQTLSKCYIDYFLNNRGEIQRLLEPLQRSIEGLLMSCHDCEPELVGKAAMKKANLI